jgi:hypothetical protein
MIVLVHIMILDFLDLFQMRQYNLEDFLEIEKDFDNTAHG